MAHHTWVQLQYTPLEVRRDGDNLIVEATEAAIESAEEESLMACWFCHTPLTVESFDTECQSVTNSVQK